MRHHRERSVRRLRCPALSSTTYMESLLYCKLPIPKIGNKYSQKRIARPQAQFHMHVSVSDLYCIFPRSICIFCTCSRKYVNRSWEYRSQTHEYGNWTTLYASNYIPLQKENCLCRPRSYFKEAVFQQPINSRYLSYLFQIRSAR